MAAIKELCRLCGKPDVSFKDLMDEENSNILRLVQDLIKIEITKTDTMSSKICVTCEDTIISFQMFVLQCKKIQETLKHSLSVEYDVTVKVENSLNRVVPEVKPEVKLEFPAEVVEFEDDAFECSISDDGSNFEPSAGEETYLSEHHEYSPPKRGKKRKIKRSIDEDDKNKLDEVLKKRKFKLNDFIKLKCHICEEEFPKWPSLRAHLSKVHKSTPLVFCLCGEGLSSKSVLYKHVSDHKIESKKLYSDLNDNEDDDCPYSKLNVNDFINFVCRECDKKCKSYYSLKTHCQRVHKTGPVVQCICGVLLKSKSVLYKHVADHKNPNLITCDKCPKVTKTATAMEKHKMKHLPPSERHFKCSGCDKVFNTKDAMKSHERSHIPIEERKIYSCEICNLKFTTRSSAAGHKRVVHCKIKSYVCDLCGYACGTGGELRQHRAIHSEDRPFVCTKCSKRFKTYSNLKTHMDIHADTSYTCYICNRVLNSRRTLRKHLLVHEDVCRHVCSYCNKAFKRRQTLKVHLYTHTGDKPLSCKWCSEKFAYASTLRSHRLRCHADKLLNTVSDNSQQYSGTAKIGSTQDDFVKQEVPAPVFPQSDAVSRDLLN